MEISKEDHLRLCSWSLWFGEYRSLRVLRIFGMRRRTVTAAFGQRCIRIEATAEGPARQAASTASVFSFPPAFNACSTAVADLGLPVWAEMR